MERTGDTPAKDTLSDDTLSGGTRSGDTLSGDTLSGDPLVGDPLVGDPLVGDTLSGDPLGDDTLVGDPLGDDTLVGDTLGDDTLAEEWGPHDTLVRDPLAEDTWIDDTTTRHVQPGDTLLERVPYEDTMAAVCLARDQSTGDASLERPGSGHPTPARSRPSCAAPDAAGGLDSALSIDEGPYGQCGCRYRVVVYDGGDAGVGRARCLKGLDPDEMSFLCPGWETTLDWQDLLPGGALLSGARAEGDPTGEGLLERTGEPDPDDPVDLQDLFQRLEWLRRED